MTPTRHPGWNPQALREHRRAHGLTLEQAAAKIRTLRLPDGPPPAASFQMIGEHERGTSYPGPRYRQAYTQIYGAAPADLGFGDTTVTANPVAARRSVRHHRRGQPANVGLERLWTREGLTSALEEVTMPSNPLERRQFLTLSGAALAATAHEWLIADPGRIAAALTGRQVDTGVVADLTTTVDALRRLDDKLGGQAVYGMVVEQLRLVVGLLRNASYTQANGRGLYAVAAELARLAGWSSQDAGNHGGAQRLYLVGLRAAREADAPGIGANILRCMAGQACDLNDPRTAIALLRSALAGSRERLTHTERAILAGQLASANGRARDRDAAQAAADQAQQHISQAQPDEDPPYVYWAGTHTIAYFTGIAMINYGDPRGAISHLTSSVAQIDHDMPRDRLEHQATLAVAYAKSGDHDAAISLVREAIAATPIPSAVAGSHVAELSRVLHAVDHPGAADLAEQARSLLNSKDI
ncbi:helix-turn-helix transcriptional regulator [Frankia sp. KB5]|uniref:helix-turn-helix domain-containing protein n=1 Tax=Frankia sp. KB5 TaxID=683318 RepID=UPI000A11F870|nr:helix-turn-helix transcriptional regulator [Frankia sp. KB5]ORT47421.1 transcriptional regulator [Frankia sp. KB5]